MYRRTRGKSRAAKGQGHRHGVPKLCVVPAHVGVQELGVRINVAAWRWITGTDVASAKELDRSELAGGEAKRNPTASAGNGESVEEIVEAYLWLDLLASQGDVTAAYERNELRLIMTFKQFAEGIRRASDFKIRIRERRRQ